jgi:hypothetical protein
VQIPDTTLVLPKEKSKKDSHDSFSNEDYILKEETKIIIVMDYADI